ncbi:unnamed protein product [Effrenium voratum]|nr:unnamed protein product [Effrenium voratum]
MTAIYLRARVILWDAGKNILQEIICNANCWRAAIGLKEPGKTSEVERALMYLSRGLDDAWVSQHDDVAYYFRLPMAFMEAGHEAEARKALDIAARYVCSNRSSAQTLAMVYPQYPLLWICEAAGRLGQDELAQRCIRGIFKYRHPLTSSGLVSEPYTWNDNYEADFFATALLAKASILSGQESLAVAAADSLLRAVVANRRHMAHGRFFLRWTWADGFLERDDPLYCVNTSSEHQLYFLLGLPSAVLLEVASSFRSVADSAKQKYQAVARELLLYLKQCKHLFTASTAYGTVCAAAMLGDQDSTNRLRSRMIALQHRDGSFKEPSQLDILEHTAEISICLCRIAGLGTSSTSASALSPASAAEQIEVEPDRSPASSPHPVSEAELSVFQETLCSWTVVSLSEPTWCHQCRGFLWGFRDQGLRCGRCARIVCSTCSSSSTGSLCRGAVRL